MSARKPPEGHINIPEAAKMAGVSAMTMYKKVILQGAIKHKAIQAGSRTFYLMKKTDVEEYLKKYRMNPVGRPKKQIDLYEIVCICCGKLEVLFSTHSPVELSHKYTRMVEQDNKLVRIRADGQLLTIRESDKLGNAYHPRMRKMI